MHLKDSISNKYGTHKYSHIGIAIGTIKIRSHLWEMLLCEESKQYVVVGRRGPKQVMAYKIKDNLEALK